MELDITNCIQIMLFALMTTVVAELATYLMIYRKDEYKNLKKNYAK